MSQNQPLTDFKTVGQPTSLPDLEVETPSEIVDTFRDLESWQHRITINSDTPQLLVGGRANHSNADTEYYLYYLPADRLHHGVAGVLGLERRFDGPTTVGFLPAKTTPADEMDGSEAVFENAIVEPVTDLQVQTDRQTEALDTIIDQIRTELTGADWSSGRPELDTGQYGYGHWTDAMNKLRKFANNHELPYHLPNGYLDGSAMHGIARYPGDTAKLLSQAGLRLDRSDTDPFDGDETPAGNIKQRFKRDRIPLNRATTSPFVLRRLLLDYAAHHLDHDSHSADVTSSIIQE
ncbi:hypothetical protein [Salinibaculum rarum]|uniref:hypothetical protein n=1 Tax=Salinibaculum rarum TaxID=3058903 RepID=UPI00265FD6C6|nr:hypothetical protein [Salinibaculum sp. KK48]